MASTMELACCGLASISIGLALILLKCRKRLGLMALRPSLVTNAHKRLRIHDLSVKTSSVTGVTASPVSTEAAASLSSVAVLLSLLRARSLSASLVVKFWSPRYSTALPT